MLLRRKGTISSASHCAYEVCQADFDRKDKVRTLRHDMRSLMENLTPLTALMALSPFAALFFRASAGAAAGVAARRR